MDTISLPKSPEEVVQAIDHARGAAWARRNTFFLICQLAFYYLQGFRRFRVGSFEEARLYVGYETDLGELRFRNEDLRNKYRTELGRWMRMDISPFVKQKGWGIDSLRSSSIGQVALDHELRFTDKEALKSRAFQQFLVYGMFGLHHYQAMSTDGELRQSIEVVPPWELIPIPSYPATPDELRGVIRYRKVPLKWLESKEAESGEKGLKLAKGKEGLAKMQAETVPYGGAPRGDNTFGDYGAGTSLDGSFSSQFHDDFSNDLSGKASKKPRDQEETYVPLEEVFIWGPDGCLDRFVIKIGKHIGLDQNFKEEKVLVPSPLAIAKHTPDCAFYTPGFVMGLISMNNQVEKMLTQLFKNVQDLDVYGTLFWPMTAGAGKKEFAKRDGKPKIVTYEVDYSVPNQLPFVTEPANTGDFPGKLVALGNQLQDKNSGQGPLFSGMAPGRVDSAAGLGFAFEVSNIAMSAPANEVATAFAQVYKSMLYTAKNRMNQQQFLGLTNIDDNVAGVVIDPTSGNIKLDQNPIPDFWTVDIDIKDRQPTSDEQKKQDLIGMLQMQLISPTRFHIINQRDRLGLPFGSRADYEQYRKAVFNNILMFGDGKTPGASIYSPIRDNPEIHLMALIDFTSRLEFSLAEKPIRDLFDQHYQTLTQAMAGFPSQVPQPGIEGPMPPPGMSQGGHPGMALGPSRAPGRPPPGPPMTPNTLQQGNLQGTATQGGNIL